MIFKVKESLKNDNGSYDFLLVNKAKYTTEQKYEMIDYTLETTTRKNYTYDEKNFSVSYCKKENVFKIYKEDNCLNTVMFSSYYLAKIFVEKLQDELEKEFEVRITTVDFEFIDTDVIEVNERFAIFTIGNVDRYSLLELNYFNVFELPID